MASVALSTKSIGSVVKLKVNGTDREFLVIHQGKPSAIYDDSCNGTWLLMKDIYETRQWHSSNVNDYANSTIHPYLNGTFLNLFETNIRNAIKQVKIPYRPGSGTSMTVNSGANGLSAKIFLLSGYEMGWTSSDNQYFPADGAKVSYFDAGTGTTATYWWLRSPYTNSSTNAWVVLTDGDYSYSNCSDSLGVRPALVLPSTLLVSDDGTVSTNTAPTAPTSFTFPGTIKGGVTFSISWSGATDAEGNLQGYYLERSINGGSNWTQVYQGSASNTTDILQFGLTDSVMYRVRSYDTEGLQSSWYTSSSQTVINNSAPGAPPTITVPLTVIGGESLTIAWGAASDSEGNLAGYKLERSVAGGAWTQIYQGANLSFVDAITKGWTTVQYRVKAYDSYSEESAYTTSATRTVDNNTAPTITCDQSGNIGDKSSGFSIDYSVGDVDGDTVTVTEKMDATTKRTFTATLGQAYSLDVTGDYFMRLLNGSHTIQIIATDSRGKSTTHTITFAKTVHACSITLATPFSADDLVTKTVMNVAREIPGDAQFQVLVSNNPFDAEPVWEDATVSVLTGRNFLFTNTTVTAQEGGLPKYGFSFRVTASRDGSALGGFIASIGGAFE